MTTRIQLKALQFGEWTNADRTNRARLTVAAGYYEGDEDLDTNIGDLLCDLRHLCKAERLDFDFLVARGLMNFEAEVEEEEEIEVEDESETVAD